jgi:serine/threonine protein kinase
LSQELAARDGCSTTGDDPRIGQVIRAKYRLVKKLSAGTTGDLYVAQQLLPDRTIAVKVFHPTQSSDASFVAALRQVMVAVRGLSKNVSQIVTVYDCDVGEDGSLFLAMELVQGHGLDALLRREQPLSVERAVRLAEQVADGLSAAHDFGIAHGDIRPNNFIVMGSDGPIKVVGFERARLRDLAPAVFLEEAAAAPEQVAYRSPEQIRGEGATPLSDVYGLGVLFYEMLSGRVPFMAPTASAVKLMHLGERPRPLRDLRPDVPEMIEAKVLQALEKEPAKRQNHVKDVANEYLYDSALYYEAAVQTQAADAAQPLQAGDREDADEDSGDSPAKGWRRFAVLATLVSLLAGGGIWYYYSRTISEPTAAAPLARSFQPQPLPVPPPVVSPQPASAEEPLPPAAPPVADQPSDSSASAGSPPEPSHGPKRAVAVRSTLRKRQPPRSTAAARPAGSAPHPAAADERADPGAVIDWLLKKPLGQE